MQEVTEESMSLESVWEVDHLHAKLELRALAVDLNCTILRTMSAFFAAETTADHGRKCAASVILDRKNSRHRSPSAFGKYAHLDWHSQRCAQLESSMAQQRRKIHALLANLDAATCIVSLNSRPYRLLSLIPLLCHIRCRPLTNANRSPPS